MRLDKARGMLGVSDITSHFFFSSSWRRIIAAYPLSQMFAKGDNNALPFMDTKGKYFINKHWDSFSHWQHSWRECLTRNKLYVLNTWEGEGAGWEVIQAVGFFLIKGNIFLVTRVLLTKTWNLVRCVISSQILPFETICIPNNTKAWTV